MAGTFASYPVRGGGGGGGVVPTYATLAAFPSAASAGNGALAIALDTNILYESDGSDWLPIASPSTVLAVGTFDTGTPSADGAHIDSNELIMQSASATNPGLVNVSTQTWAGVKTFNAAPILNSLTASQAVVTDGSKQLASLAYATAATASTLVQRDGSSNINVAGANVSGLTALQAVVTDGAKNLASLAYATAATASTLVQRDGSGNFSAGTITANLTGTASGNPPNARLINTTAPLTGGGDLSADRTLGITLADTSTDGYLSSVDWNTFNGKQASGNYITALTGDVTATGPGSVAASLVATSNGTLTTLSALTTASSLVSVGTITTGTWSATTIAVARGGTGLTSGTSGGILGYTAAGTLASSAALTANQLVIGGGAGATPSTLAAGTQFHVLQMGASNPAYALVSNDNVATNAAIAGSKINATLPTVQIFTSGSGTYTTPAGVRYIRVMMVGGGGGGGGTGAGATGNTAGGNTTFTGTTGTTVLTANGGGTSAAGASAIGGTATIVSATGVAVDGGSSISGQAAGTNLPGGSGGVSFYGGAGFGNLAAAGRAATANSGSGGACGGTGGTSLATGGGGAAGGFLDAIVTAPVAQFSYAVGAAGAAATAGTNGFAGGAGAAGRITVYEFYI